MTKEKAFPSKLPDNALPLGGEVGKHRHRCWQMSRQ